MSSIRIIYASTSGHTEFVVDALCDALREAAPHMAVETRRAEVAQQQDFLDNDLIVLASGTWNFGGVEGQLNESMHRFLFERARGIDLSGKKIGLISLGDDRYYYTTRCTEKFILFLKSAHAKMALPPLVIVNEPYDQQEKIMRWGQKIIALIGSSASRPPTHSTDVPVAY